MKRIIGIGVVLTAIIGCAGSGNNGSDKNGTVSASEPHDTVYTQQAAMMVYDYDPVRALQIIDSAVIVGNLSEWRAEKNRARIYSQTRLGWGLDSLLHWTAGARLDTARAIGERLLNHDSIKNSLDGQQDVLEMLAYTARMQNDTTTWLRRSKQLVDVCRRQGDEIEALRNEAEVGAALCGMGRQTEGLALLDSAIASLSEKVIANDSFNTLDALVIALKRKIGVMTANGQSAEVLPLARRIVMLMDDYEQHPDQYHDGSYREPPAEKRDDYIRFYRSQAQNYIATAYAALGQTDDMNATFERLEDIVRKAEAHEHQARYRALEQKMEAERRQQATEVRAERNLLIAIIVSILLAAALAALTWYWHQKRIISRKNRALVRQIEEATKYQSLYWELNAQTEAVATSPSEARLPVAFPHPRRGEAGGGVSNPTAPDAKTFAQINETIIREQLYLSPSCDRQMLTDRFKLSKERIGTLFTRYSEHKNVSAHINALRLTHASHLLISQPDMDIQQIAAASGFSSHRYFSTCFKQRFSLSPSDYRKAKADEALERL